MYFLLFSQRGLGLGLDFLGGVFLWEGDLGVFVGLFLFCFVGKDGKSGKTM